MMNAYLAHIVISFKIAWRDRMVLFFNYAFPLIFFFMFAQMFKAEQGGAIVQVVASVLCIGVLGNGFFGGGLRAVLDREANILRRFKVAPISPAPILVSSMAVGLINYLPSALMMVLLAHLLYGMPIPEQWPSLLLFLVLGATAFRAIGLIIASVANSMGESQIIIQTLYFPMLLLSGATIPVMVFPDWLQIVSQFIPATYLFGGVQAILLRGETLAANWTAAGALLLTILLCTFISIKLFRWEKEEKIKASAKLWLVAVLAPFLAIGMYQAQAKSNIAKSKQLYREMRRDHKFLIRDARIFVGDGRVLETGTVFVANGRIVAIHAGHGPDPETLKAEVIEAAGKTLLPGLIDVHVHLGAPGGVFEKVEDYQKPGLMERNLAAYLYAGVTTVKSVGDMMTTLGPARERVLSGEYLGADLQMTGPLFTAEGGHGTEYFKGVPAALRERMVREFTRLPKTVEEARAQVRELKAQGVDGIKVVLDAGAAPAVYNRMDTALLSAIAAEGASLRLPVVSHTGDAHDVADAVAAGVSGVEHGAQRDRLSDALLAGMKRKGVAYDPTLSVLEAFSVLRGGGTGPMFEGSLVQQVAYPGLIQNTKKAFAAAEFQKGLQPIKDYPLDLKLAMENLKRAHEAGVVLTAGTDSGNFLLPHGAAIHRELQLWVRAGVPAGAALKAATFENARLLGLEHRIGAIREGLEATMLLVDGNPLAEIAATERISMVMFKGERVNRADLFEQK